MLVFYYGDKRTAMISQVESLLAQSNINFSHHGTMARPAQCLFVNVKSIITGKDEKAILTEVKRGKSFLANEYKNMLTVLSNTDQNQSNFSGLLQSQLAEIEENLVKIKSLNI